MWETLLDKMLRRLIHEGELEITYPDGRVSRYGPGNGLTAGIKITEADRIRKIVLEPELGLGEGYMDGSLVFADNDIEAVLKLLVRNRRFGGAPAWVRAMDRGRYRLRDWLLRNTSQSARRNVAHHYDISNDLYRLFLDADMQYSCAYFARPDMTLEEAQAAKKAHIAAKLQISPGMKILDIGCGWGGMALTLARDYGAEVTGVTLSENQLAVAQARARDAGLADRVTFRLQDYRDVSESFDRIVSVGMLEHVGPPHFPEYFAKVHDLLAADGVALIHTIGVIEPPRVQSRWITKYIFPGGYIPSLSQMAETIQDAGLWAYDIEVLRLHYAMTLRHWLERFDAALDTVRQSYDEAFVRMWRYYLVACFVTFEETRQGVLQMQVGREIGAVPVTRGYLYPPEGTAASTRAPA